MTTVNLQSTSISLAAGTVVAVLYAVFSEPWFGFYITAVLGFAVGYFCVGSAIALLVPGLLPLAALVALKIIVGIPEDRVEPPWFYFIALVAVFYAGFVWYGTNEREEQYAA
jgi:hypothetical protein